MFTVIIFYIIVIILLASKLCICLCFLGGKKRINFQYSKRRCQGNWKRMPVNVELKPGQHKIQNPQKMKNENIENIKSLKASKGWN